MSVKDVSKLYKTPCHRRCESDELDVFEAAGYFSGYNEATGSEYYNNCATHNTQKPTRGLLSENHYYHKKINWRSSGGRMSLDVPFRSLIPQQQQAKQIIKENIKNKYKQPSSPGGRLTSFLNSLFNQAGSKNNNNNNKKKKKTKSNKDDEESPGGWRRRRRSSHVSDSNSLNNFSSGNSGFRTPPPYAPTPTKSHYKDFRSFSDHHHHLKQVTGNYNSLASKPPPLTDHHVKAISKSNTNEEAVLDDGAESDSSSDLFELQNYDLGLDVYSSGLPVYETTRMDGIKRGHPVVS